MFVINKETTLLQKLLHKIKAKRKLARIKN